VRGEIPAKRVFENEGFIAFPDIQPLAKSHFLVIPKEHFSGIDPAPEKVLGGLLHAGAAVARAQGLEKNGYRVAINHGVHGGQTVFHLHLHVLGGEPLGSFGR
jgi:histidine triad (HIT) family protein